MVICKYFLRGTCRFGENCKNEHAYNNETTTSILKKKPDVDLNVLIKSVSNDMDKSEKGNQWPLSCYGPFQGKPCFPGFEDKCFEEIRLGLYEADKNGTTEQYKHHLTQLLQEARMKMRSLQNPTPEAMNVLKELYYTNNPESQSVNVFATANTFNNASPLAGSVNQSGSIFGNPASTSQSIFGGGTTNTPNNFTFALPENKSIFGNVPNNQVNSGNFFAQQPQASQTTFASGTSIFGGATAAQSQSIFGAAQQQSNFATTTNIFNSNVPPNQNINSFNSNIFANQQPVSNQSPFGSQQNFGTGNIFAQNQASSTPTQINNPFAQSTQVIGQADVNPFKQTVSATNAHQSPFGNSVMNTAAIENKNIFAQPINPAPSIFGNEIKEAPPSYAQSTMFNSQPAANLADHTRSIFGNTQPSQGFKTSDTRFTKTDDSTVYSKLEDLNETDRKCYEARSFEFGKIPEKAPTLQMCS